MRHAINRPFVAAAAALAFSVIGLTASLSQYLSIARQQEAIKSIAAVQAPVIKSVERFIDPVSGSFAILQLTNYQTEAEQFTEGLLKSTASMTYREQLGLFMWLLAGIASSINLLLLSSKSGANGR